MRKRVPALTENPAVPASSSVTAAFVPALRGSMPKSSAAMSRYPPLPSFTHTMGRTAFSDWYTL